MKVSHWSINIYFGEDQQATRAQARLRTQETGNLCGRGQAVREISGTGAAEASEALAALRALADLGRQLREIVTADLEGIPLTVGSPETL